MIQNKTATEIPVNFSAMSCSVHKVKGVREV